MAYNDKLSKQSADQLMTKKWVAMAPNRQNFSSLYPVLIQYSELLMKHEINMTW